jgi:protein involved in sex pheromone biosynthesis
MKRCIVLVLTALVLLFSACTNGSQAPSSGETGTVQSEISAPTATPTPDFAGTDFSGRWYVFEIIDSNGMPVSDVDKQNLGGGFILELLANGTYFVYGSDGKVLGQGAYSVTLNQLTLTAQGSSTVYEIADADTLRITQTDTSITVMKREAVESLEEGDVTGGETTEDTGEGEIDEETDFEDEPVTTPSDETSPPNVE